MGEPEQQITSRPLLYQLQSYQRQEAIIGVLMMCLSTLSAQFLIQNIYSWQMSKEKPNIYSRQQRDQRDEIVGVLSFFVVALAIIPWVIGLSIYFQGFEAKGRSDIAARNKGLICGLGAVNISLVMIIIWPGINERMSFAIKVLPAYIGMVIGSL
jgi:magnesium-transporting ATPase (P-type)